MARSEVPEQPESGVRGQSRNPANLRRYSPRILSDAREDKWLSSWSALHLYFRHFRRSAQRLAVNA
jgi:hypothetical protein